MVRQIVLIPLLVLAAMVLNVGAAFGWVWVYSLIEPGQSQAAYQAYAERVSPWSSVIFGAPIWVAAGWIAARFIGGLRAAMIAVAAYVALDLAILLGFGATPDLVVALSWTTKIAAAWLGARFAARRRP